jgi:hypothetical protein
MTNLAGRPLTIITRAMLEAVAWLDDGVIIARRARCGRYLIFQAAQLHDPRTEQDLALGAADVVATSPEARNALADHGDQAGETLRQTYLTKKPQPTAGRV